MYILEFINNNPILSGYIVTGLLLALDSVRRDLK